MTLCLLLLKLGGRSVTKERGQSGILSAAGHVGFSSSFVNCCLVLSASLAVSHSTSTALFLCISPSSHHTPALVNISIIFSNFGETTLAVKHKVSCSKQYILQQQTFFIIPFYILMTTDL